MVRTSADDPFSGGNIEALLAASVGLNVCVSPDQLKMSTHSFGNQRNLRNKFTFFIHPHSVVLDIIYGWVRFCQVKGFI